MYSVRKNAGLRKNQRDTGSCLFSRCGIRDSERDSAGLFENPFMTCKISVYSSDESKKGRNIKIFFNRAVMVDLCASTHICT